LTYSNSPTSSTSSFKKEVLTSVMTPKMIRINGPTTSQEIFVD